MFIGSVYFRLGLAFNLGKDKLTSRAFCPQEHIFVELASAKNQSSHFVRQISPHHSILNLSQNTKLTTHPAAYAPNDSYARKE